MHRSSIKKKPVRKQREPVSLEFSECWLDPPRFRQAISNYETNIEGTRKAIKKTTGHIEDLIAKGHAFAEAQKALNQDFMNGFLIGEIGELSQDEQCIRNSLSEFAGIFLKYQSSFSEMLKTISQVKKKMDDFKDRNIDQRYTDKRKQFKKYREKYYKAMLGNAGIGDNQKESKQQAAVRDTRKCRKEYHRHTLEYVDVLLSVEEQKKYELVEHVSLYTQAWLNWIGTCHADYDTNKSDTATVCRLISAQRESHENSKNSIEEIKNRHKLQPTESNPATENVYEGHVLLMEKGFGKTTVTNIRSAGYKWSHRYLMFDATKKKVTLKYPDSLTHASQEYHITFENSRLGDINTDRKLLFHIQVNDENKADTRCLTFQAPNEEEFKQWQQLVACNTTGNPRVYVDAGSGQISHTSLNIDLSEHIIERLQETITYVESLGGTTTEGAYRVAGVQSKVDNLLSKIIGFDKVEWENADIRTMMSTVKALFRNLREPILTYGFHEVIIDIFRNNDVDLDVKAEQFKQIILKLPKENLVVLKMICEHLVKIAANEEVNKMSAHNISICFGPVFMWSETENIAAIQDIKYQCTVVELLVERCDTFFDTSLEIQSINERIRDQHFSLTKRTTSRTSLPDNRKDSNRKSEYDNLQHYIPVSNHTESNPGMVADGSGLDLINEFNEETSHIFKQQSSSPNESSSDEMEHDALAVGLALDDSNEELDLTGDSGPRRRSREKIRSGSEIEEIKAKHRTDTDFRILSEPETEIDIEKSPIVSVRTKTINQKPSMIRRVPTGNESDRMKRPTITKNDEKPTPIPSSPVIRTSSSTNFQSKEKIKRARARYACVADNNDELDFAVDTEFFNVTSADSSGHQGWYYAKMIDPETGEERSGLVPGPFIEKFH